MKHLFIGLVTALLVLCSYVSMSAQNIVGERAYHIYQSFYGATQTGLLTDKSLGALNPRDFSKTVMDSTNKMSSQGFGILWTHYCS